MTRRPPASAFARLAALLREPPLWLLVAVIVVVGYAATNVGELSPDPETRYMVAESIVREGDLAIEDNDLTAAADDGTHYSVFFPGQTVTFLPVAVVMELARRVVGGDPATWLRMGDFICAMLVVPLISALAVLGHMALLRELGLGRRAAAVSGMLLAFATLQWVFATHGSEEVTLGACTAWAMVAGLRAIRRLPDLDAAADDGADAETRRQVFRSIVRGLGIGGVLIAIGLTHRGTAVAAALGYVVLTVPSLVRHRRHLMSITLGLVPWVLLALAVVSIVPLYNFARYGDPLDSGYARFYADIGGLWETPLLSGLAGHLISPGKSVFVNTPWLLLLLPAIASRRVRERLGPVGPAIAAMTILHLLLYSKTTFWSGAFGIGVRFHICMFPVLLVPIALWWWGRPAREAAPGPRRDRGWLPVAVASLACLSVGMQVLGLTLNTHFEFAMDRTAYDADEPRIPRAAAWDPTRSPFLIRAAGVTRKVLGGEALPPEKAATRPLQDAWNVFPDRAQAMFGDELRTRVLWGLWGVLNVAFLGLLAWLAVRLRRAPMDPPVA